MTRAAMTSRWRGTVSYNGENSTLLSLMPMRNLFLQAVTRIGTDLFNQRDSFVKYYVDVLIDSTDIAEDPLSQWIPKRFNHGMPR